MATAAGGPTIEVKLQLRRAVAAHRSPKPTAVGSTPTAGANGHNPDTCGECRREREREEALMRDEQLLDVQTSER